MNVDKINNVIQTYKTHINNLTTQMKQNKEIIDKIIYDKDILIDELNIQIQQVNDVKQHLEEMYYKLQEENNRLKEENNQLKEENNQLKEEHNKLTNDTYSINYLKEKNVSFKKSGPFIIIK